MYEEANLAVNADAESALAAECILTTPHVNFYGAFFVHVVEKAVREAATGSSPKREKGSIGINTTSWRVNKPGSDQANGYAYRPMTDEFRYLCPWEFVRDWSVVHTKAPTMNPSVGNDCCFTRWTDDVAISVYFQKNQKW